MIKKMYSAFVSSVYESLQDERSVIINSLLDYRVFPICMEHFTVSTTGNFSDIEALIDASDLFILILGAEYGSCDDKGVSWTHREYLYAKNTGKPIMALICPDLSRLISQPLDTLTESQKKQIDFCNSVPYAKRISNEVDIRVAVGQFFSTIDINRCQGWVRGACTQLSEKQLAEWQQSHLAYDISGRWYHAHVSSDDESYLRVGTIDITQSFTPDGYKNLGFDAYNYSAKYNSESHKISENFLQRSHWYGDYTMDEQGNILGIFQSRREFKNTFNGVVVDKGIRRGIHDFTLDVNENKPLLGFHGEFHDEAPSPKSGIVFVFKTPELRTQFLEENFLHVLEQQK